MLKTVSSITNAIGALNYKGTWNASTNTPTLASGVGTKGDYYVVSVAGSTNLDGISTWYAGDWAAFNGSVWQRLEGGVDDPALSLKSNATTGLMQITGPAAGQTRVVTIPDANSIMARTDAAQSFSGKQTFAESSINLLSGANSSGQINGDTTYQTIITEGGAASYIVFAGNSAPGIHARAVFIASICFGSGAVATLIQSSFNGQSLSIQWSGNNLQLKNSVNTSGSQPSEGFISFSAIKIL